ncbi:MAG: hypothetical protein PUC88_04380 [Clostridia bacterium]|nr:hypothetical protein [Clostridia bacterium]
MKKNIFKVFLIFILVISMGIIPLTGCTENFYTEEQETPVLTDTQDTDAAVRKNTGKMVSRENEDGTVTRISFDGYIPFLRAPKFSVSGNCVIMEFNNINWYTAEIVPAKFKDKYKSEEIIAQNDMFTVYENLDSYETDFEYVYFMRLNGTDCSYICFTTNESPFSSGTGNDFDTRIYYAVDNIYTVPNIEMEEQISNE